MPYSRRARYRHSRRRHPELFEEESFRTVPMKRVPHKKSYPKGTKAIRGRLKKDGWATQSVLIPKG